MTDSLLEVVETGSNDARFLIALDIDGTVLLEDESLSPGAADAVSAAVEAGHIVTIATGRSWLSTRKVVEWLGISPELIVTANGATIMARDESAPEGYVRDVVETFDATEVLTQLEKHLPEANFLVELGDGTRLYNNFVDDWDLSAPNAHHVDVDEMKGREVTRVVVVSDEHAGDDFAVFVESMGLQQVSYAVGWSAWLDIAPQGIDKSTALEQVRERLGMDPRRVIVIGDGRNDIQMLDWARAGGGEGVVMGQAIDEVRVHGTRVTSTVHEGGVAAALEALGVTAR
ncbi:haloacid dehalogenase [Microbacterium sorbitolivorans]|uniref:HAD-IIB family hydrolase n=1 Tax=Microbacterium sorbitolivorans TaxID=1867410 RepID=UPI0019B3D37C|nr:HAD-IIB family hydrolase [Microbacterium sorbitolivorans]GGF47803.1 haloacid dehalogenase [Microbacterium sorbitolivorans]